MTAPDITTRLHTMSGMLQMGERIAYGSDAALMREAADEIASLRVQLDQAKQDHMSACRLVADMHAAATGRPGEGPVRGVVEDVADLRHQLQDMTRERDIAQGNAQMHMEAARELAVQLEAAQAGKVAVRVVRELFRFESKQQWINKAQSWFANCGVRRGFYISIDSDGHVMHMGQCFMAAEEAAQPAQVAETMSLEQRANALREACESGASTSDIMQMLAEVPAPKPAQVAAPEGFDVEKLVTAARMVTQYRYSMSYNDAYFGEAPGLFKTRVAELDRALPTLYPAAAIKAAPKREGGV
jgi:hypothetical protein